MSTRTPLTRTEKFVATLTSEQKTELTILIGYVKNIASTNNASIAGCANGFMNALERAAREV